jgi:O-antigen/teichoic acid export membrane protein
VEATAPGRFLAATSFANGSLQVLLAAGPLVLAALGATPAQVSAYFVTASLARAPMMVGVSFVPRVLAPLTKRAELGQFDEVRGMAWLVAAGTFALAAVAGVAAYLLGPAVIGLIYGPDFAISGLATGAAIAAVVAALGALGLNQVLIAEIRVARLVPSWLVGLITAVGVITLLPVEPVDRMALASLAGLAIVVVALTIAIQSVPRDHPVAEV